MLVLSERRECRHAWQDCAVSFRSFCFLFFGENQWTWTWWWWRWWHWSQLLELIASVEAPACHTSISATVMFLNVCWDHRLSQVFDAWRFGPPEPTSEGLTWICQAIFGAIWDTTDPSEVRSLCALKVRREMTFGKLCCENKPEEHKGSPAFSGSMLMMSRLLARALRHDGLRPI